MPRTAYKTIIGPTLYFSYILKHLSAIFRIFELKFENTFVRCEKYSSKLDISRSLIRIFELKFENTFVRCEKYSSMLDISRSLIRIFELARRYFHSLGENIQAA